MIDPFPVSFLALNATIFWVGCMIAASALLGFLVVLKLLSNSTMTSYYSPVYT